MKFELIAFDLWIYSWIFTLRQSVDQNVAECSPMRNVNGNGRVETEMACCSVANGNSIEQLPVI